MEKEIAVWVVITCGFVWLSIFLWGFGISMSIQSFRDLKNRSDVPSAICGLTIAGIIFAVWALVAMQFGHEVMRTFQ